MISERGFVATREGIDALRQQLHAEALRRGLGQAAGALVIGDGAVWIWRLADDRFQDARQRLDYYHAVQHLAAVGRALFGPDPVQLKGWLRPLAQQLKNQSAIKVVRQLEEILAQLPAGASAEAVQKEVNCFHEHQDRMDYRAGRRRGEPIGSGAVESTCRQAQCRFKRPGQYWSLQGDESLLCLETFWRNGRWHLLFPHNRQFHPSRNSDAHICGPGPIHKRGGDSAPPLEVELGAPRFAAALAIATTACAANPGLIRPVSAKRLLSVPRRPPPPPDPLRRIQDDRMSTAAGSNRRPQRQRRSSFPLLPSVRLSARKYDTVS